jgi:hypothetical protein
MLNQNNFISQNESGPNEDLPETVHIELPSNWWVSDNTYKSNGVKKNLKIINIDRMRKSGSPFGWDAARGDYKNIGDGLPFNLFFERHKAMQKFYLGFFIVLSSVVIILLSMLVGTIG